MEDIEHNDKGRHERTVQGNKVSLRLDNVTSPTPSKLNRTVNAPHDDQEDREGGCGNQQHHRFVLSEDLFAISFRSSEYDQEEEACEDQDGRELKVDTGDHGVCTDLGVSFRCRVERDSSESSANCLNKQTDHVDRAEDPEVQPWGNRRCPASQYLNHASENDIKASSEESRGDNECANLHEESVGIIRALGGPGSGGPT